jgi:hypothetical protein
MGLPSKGKAQRKGLKESVPRGSHGHFSICVWNSEESFNLIVLLFGEVVGFLVGGFLRAL